MFRCWSLETSHPHLIPESPKVTQHIKKWRHYFANKGPSSQGYGFSNSHVWMWELGYRESWAQKKRCFWTVVLEQTLESPLDCKKIQPVHPKGNQSWIFIGRTDVEAETPILWPPDAKNWLMGKRPWCWEMLKSGGEGDDRGWDGWMASTTQWAWVWVNSSSGWWTGRPGVLQSMGSQRVGHNQATELNWWFSFGRLYISKNLSISSRLSDLLVHSCLSLALCFCSITCNVSFSLLVYFESSLFFPGLA